ncbi:MAG: biotin/lipoyl-binding protein, partial [Muribaculaceae bacterium]|nr:biotin/lipoyl-binding protein [Muribaculaceae bacterium]
MEQHTNYTPAPDPTEVSAKEKSLIFTIVIVLLIVAAMAVVGFIFIKPAPDTIQGMGESTEVRISGKLPGRVAKLYVEEGQRVKAGDTLVHIHSSRVEARLAQAEAMEAAS